jgi:hypothetical protein
VKLEIDFDTSGTLAFTVYLDGLQFVQSIPGDLSENNAAQWSGFAADSAVTTLSDDTTHVMVGAKSIRFDTASAVDTGVKYPAAGNAHWNLTGADSLNLWIYAVNANAGGFQNAQPKVVLNTTGGSYTYTPASTLMTVNGWRLYQVPLAGGGPWTRTTSGAPTFSDVNQIEIHHDTNGSSFTLYYDGLAFGGPLIGLAATPATVVGGGAAGALSVSLAAPAPAGGTAVTLTSSNGAVASVPAALTVPAGATTAIVAITTTAVASSTAVTLTATSGASGSTVVTVLPNGVASVSLAPKSLVGGGTSTSTVTLVNNAPAGGTVVWLQSADVTLATVPVSVTVPAGVKTATFTVTTFPVAASATVGISAASAGTTAAAALTVTP